MTSIQSDSERSVGPWPYRLQFTPAEWRQVLEDRTFLRHADNSYAPRRLMGVPVDIVPSHAAAPPP